MDVAVCTGLLAIAIDAGSRGRCPPSLAASLSGWSIQRTNPGTSTKGCFTIFVAVGYTGTFTQSRWKRHWTPQRLSTQPQNTLSCDQEDENRANSGHCEPIITF